MVNAQEGKGSEAPGDNVSHEVLIGRAEGFINCCCVPLSPSGFLDTQPELSVS